jgi:acetyl esterase/lipase
VISSGDRDRQAVLRQERAARIRELGPELSTGNIEATFGLYSVEHQEIGYLAPAIARDVGYGPDPRHCLDVHSAFGPGAKPPAGAPVLIYVHGGAFVGGDKQHAPGSPYYDHIGAWAVRHGMVGVTMTYRLAPQHQWPAGAQDVSRAVAWVTQNIADYGGDPAGVVVAGHSAGATHVACYLAGQAGPPAGVAAGVLVSGIYELSADDQSEAPAPYFGEDTSQYPLRSPLRGLVAAAIPTLLAIAELDLPRFHQQAGGALLAFLRHNGTLPPFAYLQGHNHISEIAALGIDDQPLGVPLLRFVESVTGAPVAAFPQNEPAG